MSSFHVVKITIRIGLKVLIKWFQSTRTLIPILKALNFKDFKFWKSNSLKVGFILIKGYFDRVSINQNKLIKMSWICYAGKKRNPGG
jgi:hypothetical protein